MRYLAILIVLEMTKQMKTEQPGKLVSLQIEDAGKMSLIATQAHTHPMSLATIQSCFGDLYSVFGIMDDHLCGFSILHKIFEDATLMDICVCPSQQGRGFGRRLLDAVIGCARSASCEILYLEVRTSSVAARALYSQYGFVETGCRIGYYRTAEGVEDAILMEFNLL